MAEFSQAKHKLIKRYIKALIDGMSQESMEKYVFDTLYEQLDALSYAELRAEVKEYDEFLLKG